MVAHDRELIETYERSGNGWKLVDARRGQAVTIDCIGIAVPVADVYRDPLGGSLVPSAFCAAPISAS